MINDPKWFEELILSLKKRYRFIPIEEIKEYYYQGKKLRNACHVSFDDGHKTLYSNVFPIIKKHSVPISVYVSPKIITERSNFWFQEVEGFNKQRLTEIFKELFPEKMSDNKFSLKELLKHLTIKEIHEVVAKYKTRYNVPDKEPQNISHEQMLEMQESGLVTFGSHTINHPILPNESDEDSEFEIMKSVEWLADLTRKRIDFFAFPNGDCTARELEYLKKAGIKIAFSTKYGTKFSRKANPLLIPRVGFTYGSPKYLILKIFFGKYWDKFKRFARKIV
jgi:peptidoglycan/xylan/chitin deacetylase (PgdA/CDA1 family)